MSQDHPHRGRQNPRASHPSTRQVRVRRRTERAAQRSEQWMLAMQNHRVRWQRRWARWKQVCKKFVPRPLSWCGAWMSALAGMVRELKGEWGSALLRAMPKASVMGDPKLQRRQRKSRRDRVALTALLGEPLEARRMLAATPMVLKNLGPGHHQFSFVEVGSRTFFVTNDGTYGDRGSPQLWMSDGTTAGTTLVKSEWIGDSTLSYLTDVGGTLFFSADDDNGSELWKSDGTADGTVLVKDIRAGGDSSAPRYLTNVSGTLYFHATDATNGQELWKSDGTAAGTVMVKDINPGGDGSASFYLTNVGGTLYFRADDGTNGLELWKSDGTAAGTVMVKDIWSGDNSSAPVFLTNVGGTLYFQATDRKYDTELWKSDGTADGTVLVKDIHVGSGGSYPDNLTEAGGSLYFSAKDDDPFVGTTGNELWKSDGTVNGTVLVKDLWEGIASSFPRNLTEAGGTLYFSAYDYDYERDLFNGEQPWTYRSADPLTGITLDGSSNLVIVDLASGGKDDKLRISLVGGKIRIEDLDGGLIESSVGTAVSDSIVDVDPGDFSGQIIFNSLSGDDQLTLDFSTGDPMPAAGLTYHGDAGIDQLTIIGNSSYTPSSSSSGDGTITFAGASLTFTDLEIVPLDTYVTFLDWNAEKGGIDIKYENTAQLPSVDGGIAYSLYWISSGQRTLAYSSQMDRSIGTHSEFAQGLVAPPHDASALVLVLDDGGKVNEPSGNNEKVLAYQASIDAVLAEYDGAEDEHDFGRFFAAPGKVTDQAFTVTVSEALAALRASVVITVGGQEFKGSWKADGSALVYEAIGTLDPGSLPVNPSTVVTVKAIVSGAVAGAPWNGTFDVQPLPSWYLSRVATSSVNFYKDTQTYEFEVTFFSFAVSNVFAVPDELWFVPSSARQSSVSAKAGAVVKADLSAGSHEFSALLKVDAQFLGNTVISETYETDGSATDGKLEMSIDLDSRTLEFDTASFRFQDSGQKSINLAGKVSSSLFKATSQIALAASYALDVQIDLDSTGRVVDTSYAFGQVNGTLAGPLADVELGSGLASKAVNTAKRLAGATPPKLLVDAIVELLKKTGALPTFDARLNANGNLLLSRRIKLSSTGATLDALQVEGNLSVNSNVLMTWLGDTEEIATLPAAFNDIMKVKYSKK